MAVKRTQVIYPQQLMTVRLVALVNVDGVYYNGELNNGIGATFTTNSPSLNIDTVDCQNGDSVILNSQTDNVQNGIYIVSGVGKKVVLSRRADFQYAPQIVPGSTTGIYDGSVAKGGYGTLTTPTPPVVGFGPIHFGPG